MGLLSSAYGGGGGGGGGLVKFEDATQLDTSKVSGMLKKLPNKTSAGECVTQARKAAEEEKNAALLRLYAKYKLRELNAVADQLGTHANYQAGAMRVATRIQALQLNHSRSLSEYQLTNQVHQAEHSVWQQDSGVSY